MDWTIEDIKQRVTVRELAEEAGAVFRRDSSRCPLHGGDNPTAFHLYEDGRKWRCFTNCPEGQNGGDVFAFYMAWRKVDFATAKAELAARCGAEGTARVVSRVVLPAAPPEPLQLPPGEVWQAMAWGFTLWCEEQLAGEQGTVAREYLKARGLHQKTWEAWHLGWNPRLWKRDGQTWGLDAEPVWLHSGITIPHINAEGQLWGIKIRVFEGGVAVRDAGRKYRGPRGGMGRGMMFGDLHFARREALLLVEGEFDALLAWQEAGDLCDVGTLAGARKRLHPLALAILAQYRHIYGVLDDDEAGDKGRAMLAQIARVAVVQPPAHDLTDYWMAGGDLRGWIAQTIGATGSSVNGSTRRV